jgi:lipopolysaccharide export system protein LptC
MKGLPATWFGLMLLALLAALTFWIDRAVQPPQPKRDGSTRHDADYIVTNFTSTRADPFGNPRYSLAGAEMRHFPDDDSTDLVRPRFALYALKKPTTQIIADRGQISSNGDNVYFMDNVKVIRAATATKGEMTVLTNYLHIMPQQDYVETDKPVVILQAPHTVIHATGLEFYKRLGIVKLKSHVKVHYEKPDAAFLKSLTMDQAAGNKSFVKNKSVVIGVGIPEIKTPPVAKAKAAPAKKSAATTEKKKKSTPTTQTSPAKTGRVRRHYDQTSP